jgi:hypothetical protein
MAKTASFMQYMRAHGNTPGPTQRPTLAGALTGFVAEIPAALMLLLTGGLTSAAESLVLSPWVVLVLHTLAAITGGAIYGRVFSRAANDPQGGWLFGISYGFLIWMVGPVTVLQWTLGQPLALGVAAMGILGSHLIYGLTLGLLYPWIHKLLQYKLEHVKEPAGRGTFGVKTQAR